MNLEIFLTIIGAGAICALTIISLPKETLVEIGESWSPNEISLWGAAIPVAGLACFILGIEWGNPKHVFIGVGMFTIGSMLDLLDGRMARALADQIDKRDQQFGKLVDTLADKAKSTISFTVMAAYCWLRWMGKPDMAWMLDWTALIMCLIVLIDLIGGAQKIIAYRQGDVQGFDRNMVGQVKQWLQGGLAGLWAIAYSTGNPHTLWVWLLFIGAIVTAVFTVGSITLRLLRLPKTG